MLCSLSFFLFSCLCVSVCVGVCGCVAVSVSMPVSVCVFCVFFVCVLIPLTLASPRPPLFFFRCPHTDSKHYCRGKCKLCYMKVSQIVSCSCSCSCYYSCYHTCCCCSFSYSRSCSCSCSYFLVLFRRRRFCGVLAAAVRLGIPDISPFATSAAMKS